MCLICRGNPKALPTQAPHRMNTVLYRIFLWGSATLNYREILYCKYCTFSNHILTKFNSGYIVLYHYLYLSIVNKFNAGYYNIYFKNFVILSNDFFTDKKEFSIKNTISVLYHSKVSLIHKMCNTVDDSFFPYKGNSRWQLSLTYIYFW